MKVSSFLQTAFWIAGIISTVFFALNYGQKQGKKVCESKIEALQDKISLYEKIEENKLSTLFIKMDSSSSLLKLFVEKFNELGLSEFKSSELKDSLMKKNKTLKQLVYDFEELEYKYGVLQETFLSITSESEDFALGQNQTKFILPNILPLSLLTIYSTDVLVNFDGKKMRLEIGKTIKKDIEHSSIYITLTSTYNNEGKFKFFIEKK